MMLKKTELHDKHKANGARLVEFGGWEMPVQYSGIQKEHLNVRSQAGLFDISHMGQVLCQGKQSETFLNYCFTNNVTKLSPGEGQYTLLCHSERDGGTVDDLYLFKLSADFFLIIFNASRFETDLEFLHRYLSVADFDEKQVTIKNLSLEHSALALQGPKSEGIVDKVFGSKPSSLKKNQIIALEYSESEIKISRTGYTGEDGFEIMGSHQIILSIWDALLENGQEFGLCPVGLGARDSLRLEAGFPLYGHELNMGILPVEAGLMWAVDTQKNDFAGKSKILQKMDQNQLNRLIGLEMVDKAPPPRQGYPVWNAENEKSPVGAITSGGLSPSLKNGIALAYVPKELSKKHRSWWIEIRGKKYLARQHKKSFI